MEIKIKLDPLCPEPEIQITAKEMNEEITALVKRISESASPLLAGFLEDKIELLRQEDIFRVYSLEKKVYADTLTATYTLRLRLYELEQRLTSGSFVRISNSEIINLHRVKNFDLSFSGTICVTLSNGTVTYVSRRYVTRIKNVLGI